jgi:ribosomal-protein-alanine N-acetyltransferase
MGVLVTPTIAAGAMAALAQPRITGDGIVLRPWRGDDQRVVVSAFADPAIQRWHCRSMTPAEAAAWIAGWPLRWQAETDAGWAITEPGSPAALGQISLRRLDLHEGLSAISYWVLPAARGRRLAGRALVALAGWALGTLGLHRVELSHSTANAASCRVADFAGFAPEGIKRGEARHADGWHDMHLHARLAIDR